MSGLALIRETRESEHAKKISNLCGKREKKSMLGARRMNFDGKDNVIMPDLETRIIFLSFNSNPINVSFLAGRFQMSPSLAHLSLVMILNSSVLNDIHTMSPLVWICFLQGDVR